jgi:hypothetical protein
LRKPFQRILSHVEFEHLHFDLVAQWLSGEQPPPEDIYVRQVRELNPSSLTLNPFPLTLNSSRLTLCEHTTPPNWRVIRPIAMN